MPAILFDFDGVIVDSEPAHEAALRAGLRSVGMDFSASEFREKFLGFADAAIVERVCAERGRALAEGELAQVRAVKWQQFGAAVTEGRVPQYEATVRLVREAACVVPIAICSGALRREIDLILGCLGLEVPVIVSADDTAVSKPDPAPYLEVTRRLGLPAGECVGIEDTSKGVRSAKAAGCRVVGVCHAMTAAELADADLVVGSTRDLTLERLLELCGRGAPSTNC